MPYDNFCKKLCSKYIIPRYYVADKTSGEVLTPTTHDKKFVLRTFSTNGLVSVVGVGGGRSLEEVLSGKMTRFSCHFSFFGLYLKTVALLTPVSDIQPSTVGYGL